MKKQLIALFIGIDAYPDPRHQLSGCVNDQQLWLNYFAQYSERRDWVFQPLQLFNQEATRENIIRAFEHFNQAKAGDCCLLSYSGHGSRIDAPEAFWHIEADRMNETLVCYDSRLEGGLELVDKELSYLIWKAVNEKQIHFLSIMDCCFSGSNTRLEHIGQRMAEKAKDQRQPTEYLGYEYYQKDANGGLTPPRGRHVALSASSPSQTAKEIFINGATHGAFSFSLLECLQRSGLQLSYEDLIRQASLLVRNRVSQQEPGLESLFPTDQQLLFLGEKSDSSGNPLFLHFSKQKGWGIDLGSISGITPEDEVQLEAKKMAILEVEPIFSKVAVPENLDRKKIYPVRLIKNGRHKWQLAWTKESEAAAIAAFQLLPSNSPYFQITEQEAEADFWLWAQENSLYVSHKGETRPLFRRIRGYEEQAVRAFIKCIDQIFHWYEVKGLSRPDSEISPHEFDIELFQTTEPGNYNNSAAARKINHQQDIHLHYHFQNDQWHAPAIQLKIHNRGDRILWIGGIYLSSTYGVITQLMTPEEVPPGGVIHWHEIHQGYTYTTIPLSVEDPWHNWGIHSITDYFKIIVSTLPFSTLPFERPPLPLEGAIESHRMAGRFFVPESDDWISRDLVLHIHRPLPPQWLPKEGKITFWGLSIAQKAAQAAPIGVSDLTYASLFEQAAHNLLEDGTFFEPFSLQADNDLCALFYYGDAYDQLLLETNDEQKARFSPFYLHPEKHSFQSLDHYWENNILYITQVPSRQLSDAFGTARILYLGKKPKTH
ncbi:MAG TPA: caspase family protein [Saprospiraceae bacterium]|nr:caspase family protein [Saprospiraceae bacterium]HMQ82597.1 caspase family protein [Saprospiraceae bacterium]